MSSQLDSWYSDPSEDRGPLLAAVLWSLFGVATLFLGLRLGIRHTTAKIWIDDYVLVLGWVIINITSGINRELLTLYRCCFLRA